MKKPHAQHPPVLPRDLMLEILSRVPLKLLMHFKCVSKSWKSLISDPALIQLHLQRSARNSDILLTIEEVDLELKKLEKPESCFVVPYSVSRLFENPSSTINENSGYDLYFNHSYWIVGSCNGLVCLRGSCQCEGFEVYWVRLWNPATKLRSQKSPCFRIDCDLGPLARIRFAKFGFGYDDCSDTYKVVALLSDESQQKGEKSIHILSENCWRKVLSFPAIPFLEQIDGRFMSGTVNWLALTMSGYLYEWRDVTIDQLVIFSFDLRNESYRYMLLPDGLCEVPRLELELGVLRDCLCIFHDHKRTHFVMWQMRELGDAKSWTQLINISYVHLQTDIYYNTTLIPLCLSENGDVMLFANNDEMEVIMYNLQNNVVAKTTIPDDKSWTMCVEYVQSLVLPF